MILIDAEKLKLAIRDDPEIDGQNFARMKMHIEEAAVAYKLSPTDKDNNVPSKWIPVTERLPEGDKVVLCYKANRGIRFGKLLDATYADGVQAFMDRDRAFAFGVTHWMPLPEPPKEEDNG